MAQRIRTQDFPNTQRIGLSVINIIYMFQYRSRRDARPSCHLNRQRSESTVLNE